MTHQSNETQVRFINIDQEMAGQRIDNFLLRILKGVPKSHIYRILRKGEVRVNKKRVKAPYRIIQKDIVRIPPIRTTNKSSANINNTHLTNIIENAILYEDEQLLIINKPSGIAVHGGSGINLGIIEIIRQMRSNNNLQLIHRLDKDTSGCLMIAKKRSTLSHFHEQLRNNKINKKYLVLVNGIWNSRKSVISVPLKKQVMQSGERMVHVHVDGKASTTRFHLLEKLNNQPYPASLVEATLETGRTHQIRVHCAHTGHSVLGDTKYGDKEANKHIHQFGLKRLFLHATQLAFFNEENQHLIINSPLTTELQNVLSSMSKDI